MNDLQNRTQKSFDEANRLTKTAVFEALKAVGITTVMVEFDGQGDSGQIQELTAQAGSSVVDLPGGNFTMYLVDWNIGAIKRSEMTLQDAIEHLCYAYLGHEHAGWGDGDGSYGEFTFDVASQKIRLDYNERFIEATSFAHEF